MAMTVPVRVVKLSQREREQQYDLLPEQLAATLLTAAGGTYPFITNILEIAGYPLSSLHIFGDTLSGLTVDVYVGNTPTVGHGEKIATDVAANKVVALTTGARYVWAIVKTFTSGKVGITWSGALQS